MPKLRGIFDYFPGLESIPIEKITTWFKNPENPKILENQLGNRVLYPQAVPTTAAGMNFDLAILREALKIHSLEYYSSSLKKIYIPEFFLDRFPNLQDLVWAFIEAFLPIGITAIYLRNESVGAKNLGTLIRPESLEKEGWVNVELNSQKYQVKVGSLMVIPIPISKVDFKFASETANIAGKNKVTAIVCGGALGIIVDTRRS